MVVWKRFSSEKKKSNHVVTQHTYAPVFVNCTYSSISMPHLFLVYKLSNVLYMEMYACVRLCLRLCIYFFKSFFFFFFFNIFICIFWSVSFTTVCFFQTDNAAHVAFAFTLVHIASCVGIRHSIIFWHCVERFIWVYERVYDVCVHYCSLFFQFTFDLQIR